MTEMDVKRLNTWERKRLKRVYGPVAEQGMWITRTNQELREVHIDVDIVAYIKKKKIGVDGHVVRMDHGSELKKTLESKPKGRRRRGRPRLRWLEDVEKDVLEMEVKLWRQKAVDREDWGGKG